jgi:Ras-related protein Rab-1A
MSNDEPISLCEGIEVSAKFHGAFCEAKIQKVAKNVKVKVTLKDIGKSIEYDDSLIHGVIKVGATVQVDFGTPAIKCEAVVNRITDNSLYTVVFNDGDVEMLRRAKLRLKGDKHFRDCSTLDGLPLTHPEHFWSPVKKQPKTKSSSAANTCSESDSDGEQSSDVESKALKKTYSLNLHQNLLGKVVCLDVDDRNKKSITVPVLVVLPGADDMQMPSKYHILVKSFKDNKFLSTTINNTREYTPEVVSKIGDKTLKFVYDKALQYHEKKELPPSWDGMELLGIGSDDSSDSDDEPDEKKDQFVASVYSHFEERGNPLSKTPAIKNFENVELNLYKLSNIVQNLGGYKRVTNLMKWHVVLKKMNFKNDAIQSSHIKAAYKESVILFILLYYSQHRLYAWPRGRCYDMQ